ncbi:MAG: hypothetical protein AAGC81_14515 [Pseudomonadota bacterium]
MLSAKHLCVGALSALSLWSGAPANAQFKDLGSAPGQDYEFSVAPYLYLPISTTGSSTIGGVTTDLDISGSELLDALNLAGSLRAEVKKGRYSLIVDGYFASLGASQTVVAPSGILTADVTFRQSWIAALGAYRLHEGPVDSEGSQHFAIDGGVGVRWNRLRQEVDASVDLGTSPGLQTGIGGTEDWIEPVIMLRAGMDLTEEWVLGGRLELGGFGANGSELQWSLLIGGIYQPWENTDLRLGWQFYGIDFATERADGSFGYDVFATGPYLAASFRF